MEIRYLWCRELKSGDLRQPRGTGWGGREVQDGGYICISSVQSLSRVQFFATPWTAACQASLSITNSWSLLKLMPIELVMPSNHLILCRSLLLLPSTFPSIRVFTNELVLHIRWPEYWSFSFSISPSNEYSGLISFMMDWLDLLPVQGILKSILQHHSLKASILQCSAFFIVQFSHPYINIGSYKHIFDGQLFKSCFPFHTETTDELKKKIQRGFIVGSGSISSLLFSL